MTDTTDIKALRELAETAKVCGGMFAISGEQALSLLDQLEAERQRADDADARIFVLEKGEKYWFEEFKKAVAELAVLEGDQVPVAEVLSQRIGNNTSTIDKALPTGTKLFTDGQKPVVPDALREDILRCVDDSMHGCNSLSAPDYAVRVAGWLSASGIVKDGE